VHHAGDDDVDGIGGAEVVGGAVRDRRSSTLAMKKELAGTCMISLALRGSCSHRRSCRRCRSAALATAIHSQLQMHLLKG
jgi:hypothetical protein